MQMLLPMLKKYLVPIVVAFTISFSLVTAQAPFISSPEPKIAPTRNDIQLAVAKYAFIYNVPQETLFKVIFCESSFKVNAVNSTEREHSVGLSQINLKAHKHITEEQAKDIDFAIRFMAENISKGRGHQMWTTCYGKVVGNV